MALDPDPFKIRLRPCVPRYAESMARACYVEDADAVLAYIQCLRPELRPSRRALTQEFFCFDTRNAWDSWSSMYAALPPY